MIFVDTGGWVAYISPDDEYHASAVDWMQHNREPLITSDYVLDEALTLLKARGAPIRSQQLGMLLFGGRLVRLYYLTPSDILAAWHVFRRYADKEWSFTDCTSKVVIEKLGITSALSFDHHFRQFGTVTILP